MTTYATFRNSVGDIFMITNRVKNSLGSEFSVGSSVTDHDGNSFLVFGSTVNTTPANTFVATDDRTFIA